MQLLYGGSLFLAGVVLTYIILRYRNRSGLVEEIDFNHVFKDQQEAYAVLEKLPSGIVLLSNHKVVYCNRAFSDMLHRSQNEFSGSLVIDIFHPEDQRNAFKRITEVQEGGQEYSSEFRLRTREGHVLPAEVFIHKIIFESGRSRLVLIFHDLTAGRGMEQALVEFQERYNTLVEHAPEAIVVYDAIAERFVEVNRKAQELFGLNKEMLLRIGPLNVSPDIQPNGKLSKPAFEKHIQDILQGKAPIY